MGFLHQVAVRSSGRLGDPLFVMSPKPNYLHGFDLRKNLINKAMLNVDATRIFPGEVSDQFLIRRRDFKWINLEDIE